MAARKEIDPLQARKARLIRQNDVLRRHLLNESDNLREAAEWVERGHSFYKVGMKIRSLAAPFSSRRSNPLNWFAGLGRFFR